MIKRFRMVAGPNGSGKSTLMHRLAADYAVNFYDVLNADDIFAEVCRTGCYSPRMCFEPTALWEYACGSTYDQKTRALFDDGSIAADGDCVRFVNSEAINSYTIALLTNFLQAESIRQGRSFSQETVFSHPSKLEALRTARVAGYRTYLYFVATDSPRINQARVALRAKQGGHDVPAEKILSRFHRSIELLPRAFEFLSRAYFFDNSGDEMKYLAQWNAEDGFVLANRDEKLPRWAANLFTDKVELCRGGQVQEENS